MSNASEFSITAFPFPISRDKKRREPKVVEPGTALRTIVATLIWSSASLLFFGCGKPDARVEALQQQVADLQTRIAQDEAKETFDATFAATNCIGVAMTLDKIARAESAGAITADQANFYRAAVAGKIPMYVQPNGQLTTNQAAQ